MIKTLAIDFDGVIHDYKNPPKGKKLGPPIYGADDAMYDLRNAGYKLIIHTVKATSQAGKQLVMDWLDRYDIPFHEVTAIKPNADYYIDDKALLFTDWRTTLNKLGVE